MEFSPETVRAVMINEVVPLNPADDFYKGPNAAYEQSALSLFCEAGIKAGDMNQLLRYGIYVTNAVKTPKTGYSIPMDTIRESLPALEVELAQFENLSVIMLMGDVAIKSFNAIAKRQTGKPVIPSGSTYKLRKNEYFFGKTRVFPSYIMTGGNIQIEKSKRSMIAEDILAMLAVLEG